jgi:hypothetical protein
MCTCAPREHSVLNRASLREGRGAVLGGDQAAPEPHLLREPRFRGDEAGELRPRGRRRRGCNRVGAHARTRRPAPAPSSSLPGAEAPRSVRVRVRVCVCVPVCVCACVRACVFVAPRRLDPGYVKAYYRRASANFALGKYKEALKDFRHVLKLHPKDKDAMAKYRVRGAARRGRRCIGDTFLHFFSIDFWRGERSRRRGSIYRSTSPCDKREACASGPQKAPVCGCDGGRCDGVCVHRSATSRSRRRPSRRPSRRRTPCQSRRPSASRA